MNKSNHAKSKIVLDQDKFKEKNINTNTDTKIGENNKIKDHYDDLNPDFKITQINTHRISIEYLKNVLIKYLEAIAIGNEFQIKILENVIFSILKIPNSERIKLEDKRNRSSFYLNLWYNAKAYLAQKIYGNASETIEGIENQNNNEGFNFEVDKNFISSFQENNKNDNSFINNQNQTNEKTANSIPQKNKINDIDHQQDNSLNGEDLDIDI